MPRESKIEKELLAATGLKTKKTEVRQAYLKRVMLATAKLENDPWENLTTPAQEWTNGGAEAYRAGDEVEDFPDYSEPDNNPPMDEEAEEEVVEAKPKKKEKEPVQQVRKISACHTIKKIVVNDPSISVADLAAKVKESGLKVSDVTVATLRSDTRDTLRVLNEAKLGTFVLS